MVRKQDKGGDTVQLRRHFTWKQFCSTLTFWIMNCIHGICPTLSQGSWSFGTSGQCLAVVCCEEGGYSPEKGAAVVRRQYS